MAMHDSEQASKEVQLYAYQHHRPRLRHVEQMVVVFALMRVACLHLMQESRLRWVFDELKKCFLSWFPMRDSCPEPHRETGADDVVVVA